MLLLNLVMSVGSNRVTPNCRYACACAMDLRHRQCPIAEPDAAVTVDLQIEQPRRDIRPRFQRFCWPNGRHTGDSASLIVRAMGSPVS